METVTLKRSDPFSALYFLDNFRYASESNSVQKGAAMWLISHLIRNSIKKSLSHRL